jgi:hypothetical protein
MRGGSAGPVVYAELPGASTASTGFTPSASSGSSTRWRTSPPGYDRVSHCGRTKVTKGHGSKAAGLAMAFKLIESAQRRWRMVNAPHLVALVRAGAAFVNGKLVERPEDEAAGEAPPEAA